MTRAKTRCAQATRSAELPDFGWSVRIAEKSGDVRIGELAVQNRIHDAAEGVSGDLYGSPDFGFGRGQIVRFPDVQSVENPYFTPSNETLRFRRAPSRVGAGPDDVCDVLAGRPMKTQ